MIHSGEEPHYLVLINSVVKDGDLDVKNNYASVHQGGNDAGRKFAAAPLDHHVTWYLHNRCTRWWEIFETDGKLWRKDAAGHPMPTRRKNFEKISLPDGEYSRHSPGLALLLSLCPSDPFSSLGPRTDAGNMVQYLFAVGQTNYKGVCGANWGADETQGWTPTDSGTRWPNVVANGSFDGLNHWDGMLGRVDWKSPRKKVDVKDGLSNTFILGEALPNIK